MKIGRRTFVNGCCAAIAALSGARITRLAFSRDADSERDIVISIFLRGGIDAISFLAPYADSDYHMARPRLGLNDFQVLDIDGYFGLHPRAEALLELYQQGHLALIPATGLPIPNRSHFQAQDMWERGRVDNASLRSGGWLARHLSSATTGSPFDGVSMGSSIATSLEGFPGAIALSGLSGFSLSGSSSQRTHIRKALRAMWDVDDINGQTAHQTMDMMSLFEFNPVSEYTPEGGVEYPSSSLGRTMNSLAQLIKMDLGLQTATLDYGGWDTHQAQASGSNPITGQFADRTEALSNSLYAFWNDLWRYHNGITVVVMSEFGRRVKENANTGTDHGHGGIMMVLSAHLAEKKIDRKSVV